MIKKSLYIMAVLFSTVQVHSMSLNEALGSSDIEVKFNRNGRISYTNTTINEKKYIDSKDYLFKNNTYFIPSNILDLLTNTKGGGNNNLSFLASIKGKANISLQYLQSNNKLPDSITFSGDNSKYKGTLYLHPAIKNITFIKKDSVISNISSDIVIPNKVCIPASKNNNQTLKNINITNGSNILIKSSNQSNDVININENLENNKKTTLKNTKKIILRQAATVEEEQSDQQPLSINDIFDIDGLNNNKLFSIYNLLNSILNSVQDEEKKQEILSNVINNINKMNPETLSNINNMNEGELYQVCNILGKLPSNNVTPDVLFNISKVNNNDNLYWISDIFGKLQLDTVKPDVLSNITLINDNNTFYLLSDVLSKLQSNTVIKEILFNVLNNQMVPINQLNEYKSALQEKEVELQTVIKQAGINAYDIASNLSNFDNSSLTELNGVLNKLPYEGKTQNILLNISKMNKGTLSNVSCMNTDTLSSLCNVLDKLSPDKVTTEILFKLSKMNKDTLSNIDKMDKDRLNILIENISKNNIISDIFMYFIEITDENKDQIEAFMENICNMDETNLQIFMTNICNCENPGVIGSFMYNGISKMTTDQIKAFMGNICNMDEINLQIFMTNICGIIDSFMYNGIKEMETGQINAFMGNICNMDEINLQIFMTNICKNMNKFMNKIKNMTINEITSFMTNINNSEDEVEIKALIQSL